MLHFEGWNFTAVDLVDCYRIAAGVIVALRAEQALEWLSVRPGLVLIKESQHVVKRPVFQHQLNDVLHGRQLRGRRGLGWLCRLGWRCGLGWLCGLVWLG